MSEQNYLMIIENSNVVENICIWDGNPNTWQPPAGYLMLVRDTTPAKVWGTNADRIEWILVESMGAGQIGFVWDGEFVVTNQPKPIDPPPQPNTSGLETL